ncbi:MAG: DUF58 domain-containing protein [Planctomycetaceae bacterium]|nr:DUF58 domain-containing protein [Planctomycetaceae bacterium]
MWTLPSIDELLGSSAAFPLVFAAVLTIPLLVFAWWRRVFPTAQMYFILLLPMALSCVHLIWPQLLYMILLLDGVLLLLIAGDFCTVIGRRQLSVKRTMVRVASLAKPHQVQTEVEYRGTWPAKVVVTEDFPAQFRLEPPMQSHYFAGRSRATFHWEVHPQQRGEYPLENLYVSAISLLGFWVAHYRYNCPGVIQVYPDLQQLTQYAILAKTNRLSLLGFRRSRRAGQENDFERLRDFTRDDQFKFIDWRATARRNKLTVRDFQVTQSQRLLFLLDCGRMMTNQSLGLTMLDHALNSMLMLSYVALSRGDSVGLLCFSNKVECYVPPRGESSQINRMLHASYNVFPRMVETRFDEAFEFMETKNPRRSLVILMTNLIDEVNANQVTKYIGNLHGKHLPLAVFLRDHHLYAPIPDQPQQEPSDLYSAAAAADILTWRHQVMTGLTHRGALVMDAFPENLSAPLVNQYLEIKARQML